MFYVYLVIINIILLFSFFVIYKRRVDKRRILAEKDAAEAYIRQNKKELDERIRRDCENLQFQKREIDREIEQRKLVLGSLDQQMDVLVNSMEKQRMRAQQYEKNLRATAEQMAKAYETDLLKTAEQRVASQKDGMLKAAQVAHEEQMAIFASQQEAAHALIDRMCKQVEALQVEIDDYTAKQAAISEAILRQRALEEQQDFYRVCLAPETASDVFVLNEARRNLKKPEIIDKIIYDNYIAKPVLEMIKRVLQNTTCSGIYKITCQKTGEIYIGKSTDVKTRWQQHCKSAFNCGTIAHSLLHTKMRQYGLECFTFELLEKVSKDQLSEREKYYIDFYKTKETGLNERSG